MKMMGKIIDKMMGDTDKEAFEEMMPALTIKITTNGEVAVTKDKDEEDEDDESKELMKELKDRSHQYLENKE